jgi:hypothetical protein
MSDTLSGDNAQNLLNVAALGETEVLARQLSCENPTLTVAESLIIASNVLILGALKANTLLLDEVVDNTIPE